MKEQKLIKLDRRYEQAWKTNGEKPYGKMLNLISNQKFKLRPSLATILHIQDLQLKGLAMPSVGKDVDWWETVYVWKETAFSYVAEGSVKVGTTS